jgi:hypothetical protein
LALASGKETTKKKKIVGQTAAKEAAGLLTYFQALPQERHGRSHQGRSDQQHSLPKSLVKGHEESLNTANDLDKDIVDLTSDRENSPPNSPVKNKRAWQCPYMDCHDVNPMANRVCKRCRRETTEENLKAFEQLTDV